MAERATPTDAGRKKPEPFDVLIVGAGISGIGCAYRLQSQCPGMSFVILESQESFGGTWLHEGERFEEGDADASPGGSGYASASLGGLRKFQPWLSHARHAFAAEAREQTEWLHSQDYEIEKELQPGADLEDGSLNYASKAPRLKSPLSRLRVLSGRG